MGNHLKAISSTDEELRVGNYMVLFGGEDLTGEHFTKTTEFESNYTKTGMLYVDWEHGLDVKDAPQRDDILGYVDWKTAKVDETGLWVERALSRHSEYMQFLETLIEEEIVGTSSEAVGGKIRKTDDGEIQVWPLKRDALTVTPAEKRMTKEYGGNVITAMKALSEKLPHLKALLKDRATVDATEDVDEVEETNIEVITQSTMEGIKMAEETEVKVETSPEFEALMAQNKTLMDRLDNTLDRIETAPKLKDAGYVAPHSETDHPESKSFGDFLIAVRVGNDRRLKSVYKTALAEGAGATGGYSVPTEWGGQILAQAKEFNSLRRAGPTIDNMTTNSKDYWLRDIETAPDAGDTAYAAGTIAYWIEEAATITESEPRFRRLLLQAHKLAGYSLASNEVRDDAGASIDGLLAESFAMAIGSKEEYAFFRGDGVGKPKGIMNSGALITGTRSAASTVALADLAQMMSDLTPQSWQTAAWFVSNTVVDQLIQLVSNPLSWMNDMRQPWAQSTLLGLPWYVVGCLPALNTAGDILLVDPKFYLVGDRGGLSLAFSEHYKFANDQSAWRAIKRVDGQPMIDNVITNEDGATEVSPFVAMAAG